MGGTSTIDSFKALPSIGRLYKSVSDLGIKMTHVLYMDDVA